MSMREGPGLLGHVPAFHWPTCRPVKSSDMSEQSTFSPDLRSDDFAGKRLQVSLALS
jgi:hypothetical protein